MIKPTLIENIQSANCFKNLVFYLDFSDYEELVGHQIKHLDRFVIFPYMEETEEFYLERE